MMVIVMSPIFTASGFPEASDFNGLFSKVTLPPASFITPARFGAPAGSTTSDCGSDPTMLSPACNQNKPATESHPFGALSDAS